MQQGGDDDTFLVQAFFQVGFQGQHLFAQHQTHLAYVQRVFQQSPFVVEVEFAGGRSLEKSQFFQLADDLVHSFPSG